jgi:DNA-binding transcriptional LysR family regulator
MMPWPRSVQELVRRGASELGMASATDPRAGDLRHVALNFRAALQAIYAVLAGNGIAILRDAVVADDLAAGNLVKAIDLALPGYDFYPVYSADHARRNRNAGHSSITSCDQWPSRKAA